METGLSELRIICKPLALVTTFEAPKMQDNLSCVWLFALELDKAVLLPKEPMLRLIRLQWWQDALISGDESNVPLMRDLLSLIARGELDKDWLVSLIQKWQSVTEDPASLSTCWELLVQSLCGGEGDEFEEIGHNLFCVLQRRPDKCSLPAKTSQIAYDKAQYPALLKACQYVISRGQTVDVFEDGTLGFRLFGHMLFSSGSRR